MRTLPCVVALTASLASAQVPGEFHTGDLGCTAACQTQNDPVPGFASNSLPNEYAHAVLIPNAVTVAAFSIYVETVSGLPATIQAGLYSSANGVNPDANAVANASLDVDGPLGWYTAILDQPVAVPANTLFFISADTNAVRPPDAGAAGATPPAPSFWRRPPFGGTAWAQTGIITSPIYRIHCLQPGGIRTLTATGVPTIGNSFTMHVHGVTPGQPTYFGIGISDTSWLGLPLPFALDNFGAPGCRFVASFDVVVTVAGGVNNIADLPAVVPNLPELIGHSVHHQAMIFDPLANNMGLDFTNGARSVIGG